ncbi:hypothetical protein NL676_031471, partial [Syzygium grande]
RNCVRSLDLEAFPMSCDLERWTAYQSGPTPRTIQCASEQNSTATDAVANGENEKESSAIDVPLMVNMYENAGSILLD